MSEAENTRPNIRGYGPSKAEHALGAAVVASLFLFVGVGTKKIIENLGSNKPDQPVGVLKHTVQAGDTEWTLANMVNSHADTRQIVDQIDHLLPPDASHSNHTLQPGDTIVYTSNGDIVSYSEPPHSG